MDQGAQSPKHAPTEQPGGQEEDLAGEHGESALPSRQEEDLQNSRASPSRKQEESASMCTCPGQVPVASACCTNCSDHPGLPPPTLRDTWRLESRGWGPGEGDGSEHPPSADGQGEEV